MSPSVTTSSRRRSFWSITAVSGSTPSVFDLAELLDPAEDVVELGHQPLDLLVAHRDARELGDVAHLFVRYGHDAAADSGGPQERQARFNWNGHAAALSHEHSEGGPMEHHLSPYLEFRKKYLRPLEKRETRFNDWLAISITKVVGTMWCAYAFAGLALVSLPAAIRGGTATLVAWIAQTFLQLVLLSIIMVGQKVAAEKSDRQLEQTYCDAEALLKISGAIHQLLEQNTELTQEINEVVAASKKS